MSAPKTAEKGGSALVILYLITVVVPLHATIGPLSISALRLLMLVIIIPLMIRLYSGRYGRLFAADFLFPAYIFWVAVSVTYINPERAAEYVGSNALEFLGGYFVGRTMIRTTGTFLTMVRTLVLFTLALMPFAILESLTERSFLLEALNALPVVSGIPDISTGVRMGLYRAQAGFAHPIHLGLFCSIAFALYFVTMRGRISTAGRWMKSGLVALTAFFSLSSGAVLTISLQAGLIAWDWMLRAVRYRWWLLISIFVVAYLAIDLLSNRSPIRVFMSYATFTPGTAFWRAAIFEYGMQNVWANPVFGIGLNTWVRPAWMFSASVDNFWLVIAMQHGIPGFTFMFLGYGLTVLRIGLRRLSEPSLRQMRLGWMLTTVSVSFTLCTVHIWASLFSLVFFLIGAGQWLRSAPDDGSGNKVRDEPGKTTESAPTVGRRQETRFTRFPTKATPADDAAAS